MDPATLIAFSKTLFSFVSNVKAIKKLRKEKDELLAQIRKARAEFEGARNTSHKIADELQQYTEAARASDEISRTMAELGTLLSISPENMDWIVLQFEVDRLRHHGPLNNLAKFKNSSSLEPTPFKNDLSAAIQQIDAELSAFTINKDAIELMRSRASAIVQGCDMLYRIRNRAVNDFAGRLGDALSR